KKKKKKKKKIIIIIILTHFIHYVYLDTLLGSGDGSEHAKFHNLLASLYVEFNAYKLLQFMTISNNISFPRALSRIRDRVKKMSALTNHALSLCKDKKGVAKKPTFPFDSRFPSKVLELFQWSDILRIYDWYIKRLYECQVYVLDRMGTYEEALQVIVTKIKNMKKAVSFVQTQKDDTLWHKLVNETLANAPDLLPQLLDAVKCRPTVQGEKILSIDLIERIPNDLCVPQLKTKLMTLLQEYAFEEQLHQGAVNVFENDCLKLTKSHVLDCQRGIVVNCDDRPQTCCCIICGIPLSRYPFQNTQENESSGPNVPAEAHDRKDTTLADKAFLTNNKIQLK
ncbi:hypothetical protein RFI_19900, partial [Reticulomyxa filosa]